MNDGRPRLRRLAGHLSRFAGDSDRAAELNGHLADLEHSGARVTASDVGSIGLLAMRNIGSRAARDLPWWLAGLPIAILLLMPLALVYETHFFAWDVIEQRPTSDAARTWQAVILGLTAMAVVCGIVAGRRAIEGLRTGRVAGPALLVLAAIAALTQVDLFIEHTAWFSEGRLKQSHIDDVSLYSVGLYAAIALTPVVFLAADYLMSRPRNSGAAPETTHNPGPIDGRAIAAIVMPFLMPVVGLVWVLPFVVFVWLAQPFRRRLKIMATAAVGGPILGFLGWIVLVGPIDDGSSAILLPMLAVQILIWGRLVFVALAPLRKLELQLPYQTTD